MATYSIVYYTPPVLGVKLSKEGFFFQLNEETMNYFHQLTNVELNSIKSSDLAARFGSGRMLCKRELNYYRVYEKLLREHV
jgi:hypothetical protein